MSSKHDTDVSCKASKRRTARPAVGDTDHPDLRDRDRAPRMNRRRFMQGLGASAAAGVGLASMSSASATDPIDILYPQNRVLTEGVQYVGGGVSAWLGDQFSGLFQEDDLSGYTGSDALWLNSEESLLMLRSTSRQLRSGLMNTAEFAPNAVLPQAMAVAIEGFNDGLESSDINDNVDDVIEGYIADVQRDFLTAFTTIYNQARHIYDQMYEFEPADGDDGFEFWGEVPEPLLRFNDPESTGGIFTHNATAWGNKSAQEVELADGTMRQIGYSGTDTNPTSDHTEIEYPVMLRLDTAEDNNLRGDTSAIRDYLTDQIPDEYVDDGSLTAGDKEERADWLSQNDEIVIVANTYRWIELWERLQEVRIELGDEMGTFVQDFSAAYDEGEVDVSDALDPITAYTELRAEDDDNAFAGASAGLLGIPSSGTDPMEIELHESDVIVDGSLYAHESPAGGFSVGESYDPEQLEGPVFMRYSGAFEDEDGNVQEETDFVQLQQSFTIVSALDEDGLEKETVEMVDGPTYDPADVSTIEEQLAQVREEQIRLQEQAAQDASGGGFFDELSVGGVPGEIVALAAALIGVGFFAGNK